MFFKIMIALSTLGSFSTLSFAACESVFGAAPELIFSANDTKLFSSPDSFGDTILRLEARGIGTFIFGLWVEEPSIIGDSVTRSAKDQFGHYKIYLTKSVRPGITAARLDLYTLRYGEKNIDLNTNRIIVKTWILDSNL